MSCENNAPHTKELGTSGYPEPAAQPAKKMVKLRYKSPENALNAALKRGKPDDASRTAACQDPEYAFCYAMTVDKHPRDDTRQAACIAPMYAYLYAVNVDKQPRDDTRAAACPSPGYAIQYAIEVDKRPTPQTAQATFKNPSCWKDYRKKFGLDELEIKILLGQPFDAEQLAQRPDLIEKYRGILAGEVYLRARMILGLPYTIDDVMNHPELIAEFGLPENI